MEQRLDLRFAGSICGFEQLGHRLITRLGALVITVATLLFAALHAWPPK
jgi:hypothetical protein